MNESAEYVWCRQHHDWKCTLVAGTETNPFSSMIYFCLECPNMSYATSAADRSNWTGWTFRTPATWILA